MKILAASDIHGDMNLVRNLAKKAEKENVDLVILCGDLTYGDNPPPGLIKSFTDKGKKVMLVPGNHDTSATIDFLSRLYNAINLHGYAYKMDDIGFFGFGSASLGPFPVSEDQIYSKLKSNFRKIKDARKKVMITHAHPSGSVMENFSQFISGSDAVRQAIDSFKPDILLCGHVHEASGIEEKIGKTLVINAGKYGRIIEL